MKRLVLAAIVLLSMACVAEAGGRSRSVVVQRNVVRGQGFRQQKVVINNFGVVPHVGANAFFVTPFGVQRTTTFNTFGISPFGVCH